jgi:hypothetical protein
MGSRAAKKIRGIAMEEREYDICDQCRKSIRREIIARKSDVESCVAYGCSSYPDHCETSEIFHYIYTLLEEGGSHDG